MTGDVNLTHIRDALAAGLFRSIFPHERRDALAQLAAAEAVIQAARALVVELGSETAEWQFDAEPALIQALAALGDGQ